MPVNSLKPVNQEELLASLTSIASYEQIEPDLLTLLNQ